MKVSNKKKSGGKEGEKKSIEKSETEENKENKRERENGLKNCKGAGGKV